MIPRRMGRIVPALGKYGLDLVLGTLLVLPLSVFGDLNAWTNGSSGYWEEPYWSLGTLPTSGQYISITNDGWKAVAIGPGTTQNYSKNLSVYSLTVASPPGSHNLLLMNHSGLETPLAARYLTVSSNATMTMLYSRLSLYGGGGEGMSVGGEFNQDVSSVVTGPQVDIGYIGPGVYNLTSGTVTLDAMWLGGPYRGQFNHYNGNCHVGLLHLTSGGVYNYDGKGDFPTNIYWEGGAFVQSGGIRYLPLYGGKVVQTGGTNYAPISFPNYASFTLSNGVSIIPQLDTGAAGSYVQWGGVQKVDGPINTSYSPGGFRSPSSKGYLTLNGGLLTADSMRAYGVYTQNGGTNSISGDVTTGGGLSSFRLNGGLLMDGNVTVTGNYGGRELTQDGGLHIISNQLEINTGPSPLWTSRGVFLSGTAQMIVPHIVVKNGSSLVIGAGFVAQSGIPGPHLVTSNLSLVGTLVLGDKTLTQSGTFLCGSGTVLPGQGEHHFGKLVLGGKGALVLPQNTNCIVRFQDSRDLWPQWPGLFMSISNWCGAAAGGGLHQVTFGNSANALNPGQLRGILFINPLGQPPGAYAALILPSGEVVPKPAIHLAMHPDRTIVLSILGQSGSKYDIQTSTDLFEWLPWTNGIVSDGVLSFPDGDATNWPCKFYRALPLQ